MRVIAGEARGRKLKSGKGQKARPTSDRAKEALFNIIANSVYNAIFLDLFAGFGGIGIEAISRGARKTVFIEQDSGHLKIIRENLKMIGFEDRGEVIAGDVLKIIPRLTERYDIIFMDPPYAETSLYGKTLEIIYEKNLLQKEGILICEHNFELPAQVLELYEVLKTRSYGESSLTFLGNKVMGEEKER